MMANEEQLITNHLELWTSAVKEKKGAGRRKREKHGANKLRELILNLAITGKLAPADPKDEPASELLAHISKTKGRLIDDGLIKKRKPQIEFKKMNYRLLFQQTGNGFVLEKSQTSFEELHTKKQMLQTLNPQTQHH